MSRRVGVVGMGVVACCAADVDGLRDALLHARSGIRPVRRYGMDGFPVRVAGEVPWGLDQFCPPNPWKSAIAADHRRVNAGLFVGALAQALVHAGWLDARGGPTAPGIAADRRASMPRSGPRRTKTSSSSALRAETPPG